jgi:L-serine deaminase
VPPVNSMLQLKERTDGQARATAMKAAVPMYALAPEGKEVEIGVGKDVAWRQMLSVVMAGLRSSHRRKKVRVTKIAVIIEARCRGSG